MVWEKLIWQRLGLSSFAQLIRYDFHLGPRVREDQMALASQALEQMACNLAQKELA